jgi:hypothetical protein
MVACLNSGNCYAVAVSFMFVLTNQIGIVFLLCLKQICPSLLLVNYSEILSSVHGIKRTLCHHLKQVSESKSYRFLEISVIDSRLVGWWLFFGWEKHIDDSQPCNSYY